MASRHVSLFETFLSHELFLLQIHLMCPLPLVSCSHFLAFSLLLLSLTLHGFFTVYSNLLLSSHTKNFGLSCALPFGSFSTVYIFIIALSLSHTLSLITHSFHMDDSISPTISLPLSAIQHFRLSNK